MNESTLQTQPSELYGQPGYGQVPYGQPSVYGGMPPAPPIYGQPTQIQADYPPAYYNQPAPIYGQQMAYPQQQGPIIIQSWSLKKLQIKIMDVN